jgi:alpha-L-fucosidase
MADWIRVNGEAIYFTRPWKIAGEGPVTIRGGGFSEGGESRLGAADFRFTTRGNTLYAVAMGWPESGKLTIRTLATQAPGIVGTVRSVRLLGVKEDLRWTRSTEGLEVTLPEHRPCDDAWALRIAGLNLGASRPEPPAEAPIVVRAGRDGSLTLEAEQATLNGRLQVQPGALTNIGYWDDAHDTAAWQVHFDAPGRYTVTAKASADYAPTACLVEVAGGNTVRIDVPKTAGWDDYRTLPGGDLSVEKAGDYRITLRAANAAAWHAMNLAWIRLTPAR